MKTPQLMSLSGAQSNLVLESQPEISQPCAHSSANAYGAWVSEQHLAKYEVVNTIPLAATVDDEIAVATDEVLVLPLWLIQK